MSGLKFCMFSYVQVHVYNLWFTYIWFVQANWHFLWFPYVQDAEKYEIGHPSHFHYLNQSKTYELDGVSSAEEYIKTRRAMDIVGISREDQVLKICAIRYFITVADFLYYTM